MRAEDDHLTIRSYSVCFRLERRIHKIDRWRVPLPYGVPLAGVGWSFAVLLLVLVVAGVPIVGTIVGQLHPALRYVILPIGAAWVLTRWRIDGRSPSAAAVAYLRWRVGPRRVAGFRPAPGELDLGEITFAADGRGAHLRPAVIGGPARIVLRYPAALRKRRRTLHVAPQSGPARWRGTEIRLQRGQRVVIG
jgi:conjugation transfer TcpE-like protein